jgi:hypothetical protein
MVRAIVTTGKKVGTYTGRVAVRATGSFNLTTANGTVQGIHHRFVQAIHRNDGYAYQTQPAPAHAQVEATRAQVELTQAQVAATQAQAETSRVAALKTMLDIERELQAQGQAAQARIGAPGGPMRSFAEADEAFLRGLLGLGSG